MAKKESNFRNMVISLFLVTFLASASLALVYEATKKPIAEARRIKKANAIGAVVSGFDNEPGNEVRKWPVAGDTLYFYLARQGEELSGIAVETFTNQGFSGLIRLMVGFNPDGTIHDIAVLEHAETPGLGDKMISEKSYDKNTGTSWVTQFEGKDPDTFELRVKKDGGEVDAITAATITSRAFCDAVRRAADGLEASGIMDQEPAATESMN